MRKLSGTQKSYNLDAASSYHASLRGSPAEEYLEARGIPIHRIDKFLLGYVDDPVPGHDTYKGMLAIPYLRPTLDGSTYVVSIRFRCLENHEHAEFFHGKYNTIAGDRPRIFNTEALVRAQDTIAITEGELDTIVADLSGIDAVGIPGVQLWKKHFREPFLGYETVYILSDGDRPGQKFAAELLKDLPNSKQIPMPEGMDVNSFVLEHGPEALKERIYR